MADVIERIERLIIIEGKFINPDKIICIEGFVFGNDPNEIPKAHITFNGGGHVTLTQTSPSEFVELLKTKLGIDIKV